MATACLLLVLTLAMAAGLFVVTMADWMPKVKAAFDPRKSVAETLWVTIASGGIDQAVQQYHDLKAAPHATYNCGEDQLDALGYRLIHARKFSEAIRIFQLNVEAYPRSSDAYDSLADGYRKAGDKAQAIANYQKSLQLNPKNRDAEVMLQKLNRP